jgi:formylmethanofuran dehydrogenase subunit E
MRMEGWLFLSDALAPAPFAQIGWGVFDGAGNMTSTNVTSINGQTSRDTATFTYQVNADCSASVTPAPGAHAGSGELTIVDGGKQAFLVVTEEGATLSGVMIRQ